MMDDRVDELIDNPGFVFFGRFRIAVSYFLQLLLLCHLANASSCVIASPIFGNILFQAMRHFKETRQRVGTEFPNC